MHHVDDPEELYVVTSTGKVSNKFYKIATPTYNDELLKSKLNFQQFKI